MKFEGYVGPVVQAVFENGIAYPWRDALGRLQANKRIGPHLGEFKGFVIMEGILDDSRIHISYWDRGWVLMRRRKLWMKSKGHTQGNWKKYHKDQNQICEPMIFLNPLCHNKPFLVDPTKLHKLQRLS